MNFVGKIFVVLIFVMSVMFASFAVVTYATHRNWKEEAVALSDDLEQRKDTLKQLTERRNALQMELEKEQAAFKQVRVKLENEREQLKMARDAAQQQLAEVNRQLRETVAALDTAHKELAGLRTRVETLDKAILAAEEAKHAAQKEVTQLTDQVNTAVFDRQQLQKTNTELTREIARLKNLLRANDIDPGTAEMPVPVVDGLVSAVQDRLVQITIGEDDGLKKGTKLEVYRVREGRGSLYIGRVEVIRLYPDKAVASLDPSIPQSTQIRRGDRVTTKLK